MTFSLDAHINKVAGERAVTPDLERAARALNPIAWAAEYNPEGQQADWERADSLKQVRAVLLALREPSDDMLTKAIAPYRDGNTDEFNAIYKKTVAEYWHCMVDSILGKEQQP